MNENQSPVELHHKRARAVKTAWVLGVIAAVIFATFIGTAILGR